MSDAANRSASEPSPLVGLAAKDGRSHCPGIAPRGFADLRSPIDALTRRLVAAMPAPAHEHVIHAARIESRCA